MIAFMLLVTLVYDQKAGVYVQGLLHIHLYNTNQIILAGFKRKFV